MKASLLKYIICPECEKSLQIKDAEEENNEIKNGFLLCENKHQFPIFNFIPRFVPSDHYAGNFSFEWHIHKKTQLDSDNKTEESEETFKEKTGFDLKELKGKTVLDVGCGMGRFMEIVHKSSGEIIGVDISYAVNSAFENLGHKNNVHIIQANILNLPFKKEIFDFIFSIGVLHHTPDTRKSFMMLPPLLKRGGKISIWVYAWAGSYSVISNFWRSFTTLLPKKLLYFLCKIMVPQLYRLETFLTRKGINYSKFVPIPISRHPNPNVRILDTFDWYSPKYQWKHSYGAVNNWFKEAGFNNIRELSFPVSIYGEKN